MAKYVGLLSADARGKIGGLVLSRAYSGTTMRAHAIPVNKRSLLQVRKRAQFATAGTAWKVLSNGNRAAWAALALTVTWTNTLGQPYTPTAQQLFTSCAANLLAASLPIVETPPSVAPTLPVITDLTTYSDGATNWGLTVSFTGSATGKYLAAYAFSPQQVALSSYRLNLMRYMYASALAEGNVAITDEYVAVFGSNPEGVFVGAARVVDSATGFAGSMQYTQLTGI